MIERQIDSPIPHTVRLGGEEGTEEPVRVFWGDADARVHHLKHHLIGVMASRSDQYFAGLVCDGRHGLDTVVPVAFIPGISSASGYGASACSCRSLRTMR
jgi:hypothetical protein